MTVKEEYYNVYLPQKWKQDDMIRNIRNKITPEEYEFIGKLYMRQAIGEIKTEIEAIQKEDIECDGCSDMGMVLDIINKHIGDTE